MPPHDKKEPPEDDPDERVRKLKQEAEDRVGNELFSYVSPDCPAEIEEEFWGQVLAFENATWSKPFDALLKAGVTLPHPEELDEEELTEKLWDVINSLALLNVYLVNTDHLSDRELYEKLWNESLQEELVIQPNEPQYAAFLDMIGSGSEEDNSIRLKYYADEEDRRQWKSDWPEDPMPDHERPPYDRDARLPQWRPASGNPDEVM
jgi:hypothetical protein